MLHTVWLQSDRLPQAWDRTGSGSASIPAEQEQGCYFKDRWIDIFKKVSDWRGVLSFYDILALTSEYFRHDLCSLHQIYYWLHVCGYVHVCSKRDSVLRHSHREAQLECLAIAPLYLCSLCLCVYASVYHGGVDVSLQQIYLPVYLRVIMHAYFCMRVALYAIWSLGVSFFSICSSHLWRKADPLGWIGSKVIWLRICQLGIQVHVCCKSQIAFHTTGGRLRVLE